MIVVTYKQCALSASTRAAHNYIHSKRSEVAKHIRNVHIKKKSKDLDDQNQATINAIIMEGQPKVTPVVERPSFTLCDKARHTHISCGTKRDWCLFQAITTERFVFYRLGAFSVSSSYILFEFVYTWLQICCKVYNWCWCISIEPNVHSYPSFWPKDLPISFTQSDVHALRRTMLCQLFSRFVKWAFFGRVPCVPSPLRLS